MPPILSYSGNPVGQSVCAPRSLTHHRYSGHALQTVGDTTGMEREPTYPSYHTVNIDGGQGTIAVPSSARIYLSLAGADATSCLEV